MGIGFCLRTVLLSCLPQGPGSGACVLGPEWAASGGNSRAVELGLAAGSSLTARVETLQVTAPAALWLLSEVTELHGACSLPHKDLAL